MKKAPYVTGVILSILLITSGISLIFAPAALIFLGVAILCATYVTAYFAQGGRK